MNPPPWFLRPVAAIARFQPGVRMALDTDLELLSSTWGRRLGSAAVILAALFGAVSPGVEDVFTESLPFLVAVAAVGAGLPALGAAVVVAFVPFDLVAYVAQSRDWNLVSLAGRGLLWWLLWLLAVEVPVLARQAAWRLAAADRPRLGLGLGTVATGVVAFYWTIAVPFLLNPMFAAEGNRPTVEAVQPLQRWGWVMAIAAAVAFAAARPERRLPAPAPSRRPRGRLALLGGAAFVGLVAYGLGQTTLQRLLLPAAFVVAVVAAGWAGRSPGLGRLLGRVPLIVRIVVGLVAITVVGATLADRVGSDFGLVLRIAAVGTVVFAVLLAPRATTGDHRVLVAVAFGAWLVLAVGSPALADNCAGGVDCSSNKAAHSAAAAAAAFSASYAIAKKGDTGLEFLDKLIDKDRTKKLREFSSKQAKGSLGDPGKEYEQMTKEATDRGFDAMNLWERIKALWNQANEATNPGSGGGGEGGSDGDGSEGGRRRLPDFE